MSFGVAHWPVLPDREFGCWFPDSSGERRVRRVRLWVLSLEFSKLGGEAYDADRFKLSTQWVAVLAGVHHKAAGWL